ncbi:MAG: UvrD-helicase domain-containing protein, partial [Bacillota bacterium]
MPDELTASQERAATTFDRHLVVTAGAGAGKTRVLIARVMGLLEQGLAELDQVVALTFTNKAALEMKERLRQALEQAAAAASGEQAALWERRKRDLDQARITTIHSFCTQLLREYPVEARVDPQFTVLEEMEAAIWLHQALDESLLGMAEQGDEGVAQLLSIYPRGALLGELAGVYGRLREHGLEPDEALLATARSLDESRRLLPDLARAVTDGVAGLLAGLQGRAGDGKGKANARASEQAAELQARWGRAGAALEQLLAVAAEGRTPGPEDLALLERLAPLGKVVTRNNRSLLAEIDALAEPLNALQDVVWGLAIAPASLAAGRLLQSAHDLYQERKLQAGALDFSDLQILARDLLRRPEIAADLRQRFPYLMVDEYQDTNPLQSQIIHLWQPANLFLVGDPKQSIYRFRGAEVELFRRARQEIPAAGGEEVLLAENFRSRPGLIHFSNYFFRALMQDDYEDALPGRPDAGGDPAPSVEVLLPRALKEGEAARDAGAGRQDDVALEAEAVAAHIERLVEEGSLQVEDRPVRWGDIAVLMRATTDMGRYEQALRERGIPYFVVSGRGFYGKQEIRDCLNLLRALDNPADEISLVGALRSPFFGLSDETLFLLRQQEGPANWLGRLDAPPGGLDPVQAGLVQRASRLLGRFRLLQARLPLPDLLETVLEETGYGLVALGGHGGEQVAANLRKLTALARRFSQAPLGLRKFISLVEEFEDREAREGEAAIQSAQGDTVKLMSVHQSKGLEFPVVVVADLARTQQPLRGMIYRPELGIGLSAVTPDGERRTTWLRRRLEEEERRLERQESMRVLYVAATRARDRLVLAGTKHRINTARDYMEMASWLEWLCRALGITDTDELQAARREGEPSYRPFAAPSGTAPELARVRLWLPDEVAR